MHKSYDLLIAGGGNAALCAALTAREAGATVLVVEHAPPALRGGNSRHTRNLRVMHEKPTATLTGAYTELEYWSDLVSVTRGKTDERLARTAIRGTAEVLPWMQAHGVCFQPSLRGTLSLSRTNAFFLGGGKALLNAYYAEAERMGIDVAYDTEVRSLRLEDGVVRAVEIASNNPSGDASSNGSGLGAESIVEPKAVVVSSGGFQANLAWLREYWGDATDNFVIRGHRTRRGGFCGTCWTRALRRSAIPHSFTLLPWTLAHLSLTAALSRGLIAFRSASWWIVTQSASMTRARTYGPSGTPPGDDYWRSAPNKSHTQSSIANPKSFSCLRFFPS